jgi:hypothetical protein
MRLNIIIVYISEDNPNKINELISCGVDIFVCSSLNAVNIILEKLSSFEYKIHCGEANEFICVQNGKKLIKIILKEA